MTWLCIYLSSEYLPHWVYSTLNSSNIEPCPIVNEVLDVPLHFPYLERSSYKVNFNINHHVGLSLCIKIGDYLTVNGFSNFFYGWGFQDQDLFLRLKYYNLVNSYTRSKYQ